MDDRTVDTDVDRQVLSWLEGLLGGTVTRWSRQPRWRPMWFCTVETPGETHEIVVRAERGGTPLIFPLDHEMRFFQVMEQQGLPVPHVYGWCDEPRAYAMAAVPGQAHFDGTPEADRRQVVDEYLQALAKLHSSPIEPFVAAGIARAARPSEAAWLGFRRYEDHYRSTKVRPAPLMEFVIGWLKRNPLPPSEREAAVVWDSGQFHHHDGHLAAILDTELGHIGDPMMDLAAWRMRDTVIPFGDFTELYARYEELSGQPVDLAAIQWHHLMFTLTNELSMHREFARPEADTDYMTYAQWISETNLHAIESLAEYLGVELEPVGIPEPASTPVSEAHSLLSASLRSLSIDDPYLAYRVRAAFRLARHLERFDQIGAEVTENDIADVAALIGRTPSSWEECEAELERFVLADDGRHDPELIVLFDRRYRRYKALMGPPGSAMAAHHLLQPFSLAARAGSLPASTTATTSEPHGYPPVR